MMCGIKCYLTKTVVKLLNQFAVKKEKCGNSNMSENVSNDSTKISAKFLLFSRHCNSFRPPRWIKIVVMNK